jgi:hypothetical protein
MPKPIWAGIGGLLVICVVAVSFGAAIHPIAGLIIFLLGFPKIIGTLGWSMSGYESLRIERSYLIYKFGLLGFRIRRHRFRLDRISNVRLAAQVNNDQWRIGLWSAPPQLFRKNSIGMVTFDVGPVPFSFGTSISPAEARTISAELATQVTLAQKNFSSK